MSNSLELQTKPILSLCMIVKNEIHNLPRCLDSVKPYVDEIIVVDTGSQDGTPELALQYGAKVKYFEWCDDFAAARNYSIAQASGDWILALDADEELIAESKTFLEQLTLQPETIAYLLSWNNVDKSSQTIVGAYVIKVFRNLAELKYSGRFHEQLRYQNQRLNGNQIKSLNSVKIIHYGHRPELLKQKNITRNIPLLERIRQEEGLNLMLLYCLAEFYQNTQQPEKSKDCYAEALERLGPHLKNRDRPEPFSYVPSLIYQLGKQLLLDKEYKTSWLLCQRGLEWSPNFPPLNTLAAATLRALGFPLKAIAYLEKCLKLGREGNYDKGEPFDLRFVTTVPAYDLGNIYIDLERAQDALAAFELALSFDANFTAAQEKAHLIRQYLGAIQK